MVTVEKVSGGRYHHRETGVLTVGDRTDVSEALAAYLCDERGDFDRVEGVTTVDYEEVDEEDGDGPDYTSIPPNPEDMTKAELYEVAADLDIEGRSEMTKAELIDALQED